MVYTYSWPINFWYLNNAKIFSLKVIQIISSVIIYHFVFIFCWLYNVTVGNSEKIVLPEAPVIYGDGHIAILACQFDFSCWKLALLQMCQVHLNSLAPWRYY